MKISITKTLKHTTRVSFRLAKSKASRSMNTALEINLRRMWERTCRKPTQLDRSAPTWTKQQPKWNTWRRNYCTEIWMWKNIATISRKSTSSQLSHPKPSMSISLPLLSTIIVTTSIAKPCPLSTPNSRSNTRRIRGWSCKKWMLFTSMSSRVQKPRLR